MKNLVKMTLCTYKYISTLGFSTIIAYSYKTAHVNVLVTLKLKLNCSLVVKVAIGDEASLLLWIIFYAYPSGYIIGDKACFLLRMMFYGCPSGYIIEDEACFVVVKVAI